MATSYQEISSKKVPRVADDPVKKKLKLCPMILEEKMIDDALQGHTMDPELLLSQMSPVSTISHEPPPHPSKEKPLKGKSLHAKKAVSSTKESGSHGGSKNGSKQMALKVFDISSNAEKLGHLCETCGKRFDRRYNLKVHMRRHTGETPYLCPIDLCPKQFKWRSSMAHHVRAHHGGTTLDILGATSRRKALHQKKSIPNPPASRSAKKSTDVSRCEVPFDTTFVKGHFFDSCEDTAELILNRFDASTITCDMEDVKNLTDEELFETLFGSENKASDPELCKNLDFPSSYNGFEPDAIDLSAVVRDSGARDLFAVNPF